MTSTTLLEERVLPTDRLGRVRTPPERREALLEEFARSGMSGAKFAQFIGMKYSTLANWVQKRRRQGAAAGQGDDHSSGMHWMEAVLPGEAAAKSAMGALQVHLPGGARLEVADRRQAVLAGELLRALGAGNERPLSC